MRNKINIPRVVITRCLWGLTFTGAAFAIIARFIVRSPLWLDEALTVNIARLPVGEIAGALRKDGAPPLYYWLLHFWMELFGTGDTAVRSLAALFSVLTILLMWKVVRAYADSWTATAASVVMAVAPFSIRYGSEARMYSMLMVECLIGMLLFRAAIRGNRLALLGVTGIAGALALTHYWGIWLVLVSAAFFVFVTIRSGAGAMKNPSFHVVVALGLGGVLFLPWLDTFQFQAAHTGTPWADAITPVAGIPMAFTDWTGGGSHAEAVLLLWGCLFLMLVAVFSPTRDISQTVPDRVVNEVVLQGKPQYPWNRFAVIGLGALGLGLVLAWLSGSAFQGRYSAPMFPFFVVLVAVGIGKCPTPLMRQAVLCVVVVFSVPSMVRNIREDRTQAGQVGTAITAGAQPGDVVVVCPDQLGPSIRRTIPKDIQVIAFPEGDGQLIDWVDYADRNAAADPGVTSAEALSTAEGHTVWFVMNYSYRTFEGKCEQLQAALAQARPKNEMLIAANTDVFELYGLQRFVP